jgi:glucuronate isomerase
MSQELRARLFRELDALEITDPHTHINPLAPASATLADILGYHYYTELAHSAGLPRAEIEGPSLDPREKVARLVAALAPLENTAQYAWLIEMLREFFGFDDERLTPANQEAVYNASLARMAAPDWADQVLAKSRLKAVFLTNDFDDPLEGFDSARYIPCLRTDDLVFHLARKDVRDRLERRCGQFPQHAAALRTSLGKLFDHFMSRGAKACAISLPPEFTPSPVGPAETSAALHAVLHRGGEAGIDATRTLSHAVFWTLAELCADYKLPFDLMIGVNRRVYADGVFQGQDLFDSRVSLLQYRALFNAFPQVLFPVSVLASSTNQELAAHAWIFPNVITSGHWWYSNTPSFIEHDAAARLEAVPQTKQIGYYSDMYKLEFALPKFAMYKRVLAKILAERFVIDRRWSEGRALALGRTVLRDNTARVFGVPL